MHNKPNHLEFSFKSFETTSLVWIFHIKFDPWKLCDLLRLFFINSYIGLLYFKNNEKVIDRFQKIYLFDYYLKSPTP